MNIDISLKLLFIYIHMYIIKKQIEWEKILQINGYSQVFRYFFFKVNRVSKLD